MKYTPDEGGSEAYRECFSSTRGSEAQCAGKDGPFWPHVVEPAVGLDRLGDLLNRGIVTRHAAVSTVLAFLTDAYHEEKVQNGEIAMLSLPDHCLQRCGLC